MSGCHPIYKTGNCLACSGSYLGGTSPPPCVCNHSLNKTRKEEDVSPMVKKIQILEKLILEFIRDFQPRIEKLEEHKKRQIEYQEDNGSWKLGVKGDIVSLNDRLLEAERTIAGIDGDMSFVPTFESIRDLDDRIKQINDWILDKQEFLKYLDDRIDKLEEHKNRQIDENRKISRCFDELERCIDVTVEIYKNKASNKPHRCPVCEGKVKILIDPSTPLSGFEGAFGQRDANGIYYRNCVSCEGSGIVWG